MRRLSFKLPIVLRYSLFFSGLMGGIHMLIVSRKSPFKYWILASPLAMMGLCYEEIGTYFRLMM